MIAIKHCRWFLSCLFLAHLAVAHKHDELIDAKGKAVGELVSLERMSLYKSGFYFDLHDFDFKRSPKELPQEFNYLDAKCEGTPYRTTGLPVSNIVVRVDEKDVYFTSEKIVPFADNQAYYYAYYAPAREGLIRECKLESAYNSQGVYFIEVRSMLRSEFLKKTGIDFSDTFTPPFRVKFPGAK